MQLSGIAHQIWDDKYRFKDNDGNPRDVTVEDTFKRVAVALASVEEKHSYFEDAFYDAMEDFSVLPAGRIIAGAGTGRKVTLQNCYVMGAVPDALEGIQDMLKYTALTMKTGGGTGTDFSTLRPAGALVKGLGVSASGPLTFMDQWDSMCRTIMSAGHRRGAMMGTMRVDHPDIEAFIDAKRDAKRFRMFNLSVLVTDEFMTAVSKDADWTLHFDGTPYKQVNARQLWDRIMQSTYDCADPGVIFIDRVNGTNPLAYAEKLTCTNPCAEQPLPPWGACCLGSINLTQMVLDPFMPTARINNAKLDSRTQTLVRMLDNVLDVTHYPLEQQRKESMDKRRIGVGITGFADMLVMLGVRYDSPRAVQLASEVTGTVHRNAEEASQRIGEEKGSFPLYDSDQYQTFGVGYTPHAKHHRNSHLTSIAPTGTISLFAGNISSGIEPIFDLILNRKILQKDNTYQEVEINDYAYEQWCKENGRLAPMPDVFVTTAQIKPINHLNVLAACVPNVDSSISKTINCPEDISYEDFKDIYLKAYELGVKSCTTYRPNKVTGSILSSGTMSVSEAPMSNVVELTKPLVRPAMLRGATYRLKPPNVEHALFITINDIEEGSRWRPYEIFINTKNLQFQAWSVALTRMISAIFRRGGDVSFITEELLAVFDPNGGGYWEDKKYVPSLIAGIGKVIQQHLDGLGVAPTQAAYTSAPRSCPQCSCAMVNKEGCWSCTSCTHTACG